jgi:hypothetical protein
MMRRDLERKTLSAFEASSVIDPVSVEGAGETVPAASSLGAPNPDEWSPGAVRKEHFDA